MVSSSADRLSIPGAPLVRARAYVFGRSHCTALPFARQCVPPRPLFDGDDRVVPTALVLFVAGRSGMLQPQSLPSAASRPCATFTPCPDRCRSRLGLRPRAPKALVPSWDWGRLPAAAARPRMRMRLFCCRPPNCCTLGWAVCASDPAVHLAPSQVTSLRQREATQREAPCTCARRHSLHHP